MNRSTSYPLVYAEPIHNCPCLTSFPAYVAAFRNVDNELFFLLNLGNSIDCQLDKSQTMEAFRHIHLVVF